MDAGPAVLAVVLQTGDVGTEEGGELPPTAGPLALIAHLVVQDVRLHLHLGQSGARGGIKWFYIPSENNPTYLQTISCQMMMKYFTSFDVKSLHYKTITARIARAANVLSYQPGSFKHLSTDSRQKENQVTRRQVSSHPPVE